MKSPLVAYNAAAKEFGITPEKQLHIRQKMQFAETQVQEMQAVTNRLLFDIAATMCHLDTAKDDNSKAAYEGKLRGYQNDLRQMSASLDYAILIQKELGDEFKQSGEEA